MIVVTGATGGLGSATVENLLERAPADRIGVSVRDVAEAQHFADRGVRVRQGSYEDPAALRNSFAGAEQVLLVSGNDPASDLVVLHRNAIEAALAESGVAWTALRNGAYGTLEQVLGPWQQTGQIAGPQDGPVPYTDRADVAEATSIVLAGDRCFDGPITLTAPTALTFDDFAAIASDLTGRTIERTVLNDERWVADQIATGVPEQAARFMLTWYQASRAGYFAEADPLMAELLGREPRSAADRLAAHAAT